MSRCARQSGKASRAHRSSTVTDDDPWRGRRRKRSAGKMLQMNNKRRRRATKTTFSLWKTEKKESARANFTYHDRRFPPGGIEASTRVERREKRRGPPRRFRFAFLRGKRGGGGEGEEKEISTTVLAWRRRVAEAFCRRKPSQYCQVPRYVYARFFCSSLFEERSAVGKNNIQHDPK